MGAVFLTELLVVARFPALFDAFFVATDGMSLGLLLGPTAHGAFVRHYLPNMGLLLLYGWPLEDQLSSREFLVLVVLTAYVPTYSQIIYSTMTNGAAGTLSFSGAVYAFPPALLCVILRRVRSTEYKFGTFGLISLGMIAAIPLNMLGYLEFISGLPSAKVTHTMGYVLGWGYGILKLQSKSKL